MEFPARVFGPGLPAEGAADHLIITGEVLCLGKIDQVLPASGGRLRPVGFSEPGIELSFPDSDTSMAIHVLAEDQVAMLLAALPSPWENERQRFFQTEKRKVRRRRLGMALLVLVIISPFLGLWALSRYADPIADRVAQMVSPEMERKLGEAVFAQVSLGLALKNESPAQKAVATLGTRLTQGSRYAYQFHVVESKVVNAFALPGGIVVVHSGLLATTKRPEELAGVLAHEVQHVELRHGLRRVVQQMGLTLIWAMVTGDLGATLGGQAAQELLGLKFSRDAEREADLRGLQALAKAGIDASGMPAFFATLASQASPPEILSSHPHSGDRQKQLETQLRALPPISGPPLDMGPWPPALQ